MENVYVIYDVATTMVIATFSDLDRAKETFEELRPDFFDRIFIRKVPLNELYFINASYDGLVWPPPK